MARGWLRRYAAPTLLGVVAAVQIALAQTQGLSPWLGGGFGMFATVDSQSERHLVVYVDSPGLIRELSLPDDDAETARRVRALPTARRLEALAEALLARERERIAGIERVRVQLWQTRREPGSLRPEDRPIREAVAHASSTDG